MSENRRTCLAGLTPLVLLVFLVFPLLVSALDHAAAPLTDDHGIGEPAHEHGHADAHQTGGDGHDACAILHNCHAGDLASLLQGARIEPSVAIWTVSRPERPVGLQGIALDRPHPPPRPFA